MQARKSDFSRGAEVRDVKERRKGIIIQASVGYTKKSRTPVHRVADKHGDVWLAKEKNLELLY